MARAPHDYTDLFLAPVALGVDQRLEEFAGLAPDELRQRIAIESNQHTRNATDRGNAVVASATYLMDLHGWTASWDSRGVRLSHDGHSLVLGAPPNVLAYVADE